MRASIGSVPRASFCLVRRPIGASGSADLASGFLALSRETTEMAALSLRVDARVFPGASIFAGGRRRGFIDRVILVQSPLSSWPSCRSPGSLVLRLLMVRAPPVLRRRLVFCRLLTRLLGRRRLVRRARPMRAGFLQIKIAGDQHRKLAEILQPARDPPGFFTGAKIKIRSRGTNDGGAGILRD